MAIREVFTVGTDPVHLGASRGQVRDGVEFYADIDNVEPIYIGDYNVTGGDEASNCEIRLAPGERTRLPCKHIANYYAISDAAGQVLRVSGT